MVIRAIHLEVVQDMSTASFLRAFRRFIARRGTTSTIQSDNAKQFKLAKELLKDLTGPEFNDEIVSYMTSEGINWKFIPDKSPWFGGYYERLVSLVKTPLRKVIGKSIPCLDELVSITTEIEALVNSRPLVYVDADRESPKTITPKDFLSLNLKTGIPFVSPIESDLPFDPMKSSSSIQSWKWESGQATVEEFWRLWYTEYLLSLRERYQLHFKSTPGEVVTSPQVGTVVLVKDDNLKRGQWKLGRITELIKSRDGEERVALLRMPNGRVIRRAIKLLYPIETSAPDSLSNPKESEQMSGEGSSNGSDQRPKRSSKSKANAEILKLFQS